MIENKRQRMNVLCVVGAVLLSPALARAQAPKEEFEPQLQRLDPNAGSAAPTPRSDRGSDAEGSVAAAHHSVALDVPRVAYTDSAFGSGASIGAAGFGELRNGVNDDAQAHLGGGLRLWASPIDRLLFVFDAQRNTENDRFAPAFTGQLRLFGGERQGFALAALARYKAEGFAELEGELETGLLASFAAQRLHLDANLLAGADFDGRESDGEALARSGYDVLPFLRLGVEGRVRARLSGKFNLPGNRTWDAFGGPQVFGYFEHYFGAITGGPSTVGISDQVGWSVIASAGGVVF